MSDETSGEKRASFSSMTEGTAEDWMIIGINAVEFNKTLPDRVLDHLRLLDGDFGGFPVDRLTHSLQSATKAYRDNMPDEYVMMALLHDIGDTLASRNHGDIASAIIKPYVSDKIHWICQQHPAFQGYYFLHHLGKDRNVRDQFKDHEWYDECAAFCELHDQNCFEKNYKNEPLEFFEPVLKELMARSLPGKSIYEG